VVLSIIGTASTFFQTANYCVCRESSIMFLAHESFFLRYCGEISIMHQRSGAVMVIG
jgi:hypothetical protein